jgi:hypothetical protein
MAGWHPIKRRDFIDKLIQLGFSGPYRGTKHDFLLYGAHRQAIPSNAEFSVHQLRMLLRQLERPLGRAISAPEWEKL